jgi:hypothetical protein
MAKWSVKDDVVTLDRHVKDLKDGQFKLLDDCTPEEVVFTIERARALGSLIGVSFSTTGDKNESTVENN